MWLSNDCTCVYLCVLYAIYIWKSAFHLWYLLSRIATMFTILQLHLLHKPKRELETNRVKCTHFVLLKYWNKITNGLRKVSVLGGEAVVAAYTRGLLCIISCASFFRLCHIDPFHRTTCTVAKDILNFWWQQIYKHNISLFHIFCLLSWIKNNLILLLLLLLYILHTTIFMLIVVLTVTRNY